MLSIPFCYELEKLKFLLVRQVHARKFAKYPVVMTVGPNEFLGLNQNAQLGKSFFVTFDECEKSLLSSLQAVAEQFSISLKNTFLPCFMRKSRCVFLIQFRQ